MIKVLLLLSLVYCAFAEVEQTIVAVSSDKNDVYRELFVNLDPGQHSLTVTGVSVKRDADGTWNNGSASAEVDAACFKMQALQTNDLCYYFGAAQISLNIDWSSTNGFIGKVNAALGEVVFCLSSICVYEDHDGQDGYQMQLGKKLFCPPSDNTDCMVAGACIDTKAITWAATGYTTAACPTGQGYKSDCKVYTISAVGTWYNGLTPYQAFTVTLTLASQNVIVNGNNVGPYNGKTDWSCSYPWARSDINFNKNNSRLTKISYVAGKTATIQKTTVVNDDGWSFAGSGKETYLSYAPSAQVDGSNSDVVIVVVSNDQIQNYVAIGDLLTDTICAVWKVAFAVWKGFGWNCQVVFFSWKENMPTTVYYDPSFGQDNTGTSSALTTAPGLMLPLFICIVHYFYRKF